MDVLRVRNWDENFENNRTKELKILSWVPLPNKHDGDGYTELLDHKNGSAHFGAWVAIVQVASRCRPRGTLLRDGQKPHDERSIARITRIPEPVLHEAISRLIDVGWLERITIQDKHVTEIPQDGAAQPQGSAAAPQEIVIERTEQKEGKGTEGNGTEGKTQIPASGDAVRDVFQHYRVYHPRAHPSPRSDSPEWRKIVARLREGYSVDDLKLAIDGCHKSPFHCGENERNRVYQSLELIVRDASKVNQFVELACRDGPVLSERTMRGIRAKESFLSRMRASGNGSGSSGESSGLGDGVGGDVRSGDG